MKKTIFTVMGLCLATLMLAETVTVYNGGFALVRSDVDITAQKGRFNYVYDNVPSGIEPASLVFKTQTAGLELLAQNYEYDLADGDAVLAKYVGKNIMVTDKKGGTISGVLLFTNGGLGLQSEGGLVLQNRDEVSSVRLDKLPDNFYLKPTLNWELQADKAGKARAEISYITNGISWDAVYNCVLSDDHTLVITPWVNLNNNSGRSYDNVNLKLMAGDVQKERPSRMLMYKAVTESMNDAGAGRGFDEKSFAEYHLYTLSQPATLADRQMKQLALFPTKSVKAARTFYQEISPYGSMDEQHPETRLQFINSVKDGLGMPLPGGVAKVYQMDAQDNSLEFVGEDSLTDTARDQKVSLTIGRAFDLTVVSKMTEASSSQRKSNTTFQVTVSNAKKTDAEVVVAMDLGNNARIYDNSLPFNKVDATRVEFTVPVPAGGSTVLTFSKQNINNR